MKKRGLIMMSKPFKRTLADVRAAYAEVQNGALGKKRWVKEGASSYTVTVFERDGYRGNCPTPSPCSHCLGDGQVCNVCERPGGVCRCPESSLPTPMACPDCGGINQLPPLPGMLIRFHWWCMWRASCHDRPGYPLIAFLFDWVGGRAADLGRWMERAS
jgi:hypothetical protein